MVLGVLACVAEGVDCTNSEWYGWDGARRGGGVAEAKMVSRSESPRVGTAAIDGDGETDVSGGPRMFEVRCVAVASGVVNAWARIGRCDWDWDSPFVGTPPNFAKSLSSSETLRADAVVMVD